MGGYRPVWLRLVLGSTTLGDVVFLPSDLCAFGSEGSGNQIKMWYEGKLIKLNSKYREASKEVSAYLLGTAFGLSMTCYKQGRYKYKGSIRVGCECESYLGHGDESVSVYTMIQSLETPAGIALKNLFRLLVTAISQYTYLSEVDISLYLMKILTFDFLICNNDRHLSNIEFIRNKYTNMFRPAPLFDHGGSFLRMDSFSGNQRDFERALSTFKSRPFSDNPMKNLIDIECAKLIAKKFASNLGGVQGLNSLPLLNLHKRIVRAQFEALLGGDFR